MTIGEKIKLARTLKNLTQKELGVLVGLSDDRIRKYELDTRTPKESMLDDFAKALDVPIEFFTSYPTDYTRLMHLLFELELTHGLKVIKIKDGSGYALKFDNKTINEHLKQWYNRWKEKTKDLQDRKEEKEIVEADYLEWKIRYPLSYAEECMSALSKKRHD